MIPPASWPCPKLVFVTSTSHDGDLGGIAGADGICAARAAAAGLKGTYYAWVSTGGSSPNTHFTHSTGAYKLVGTGATVANSWADLTGGSILTQINRDEFGATVTNGTLVWTGTNADGTRSGQECSNWTTILSGYYGSMGQVGNLNSFWSNFIPHNYCDSSARLYCFQQ